MTQRDHAPHRVSAQLAHCLPDLAAAMGYEPPAAASPDHEVEIRPRDHREILAAATVAGVDPRMQILVLSKTP
jgi:hypothetical protein